MFADYFMPDFGPELLVFSDDSGSMHELKAKHNPDISQTDLPGLYAASLLGHRLNHSVWVSHPSLPFPTSVRVL